MSNQTVQLKNEVGVKICANIDCKAELIGFDIKNQNRFCRRCRISQKTLRWKCGKCPAILDNNYYREGRKYCNNCA